MISGFTYVVSNSEVQIPASSKLGGVKRQDIFAILVSLGFLSALSSTIASNNNNNNNIIKRKVLYLRYNTKQNNKICLYIYEVQYCGWFLERYPTFFIRLPLNFLIFSLMVMLGSLLTTIDALYSRKVFWIILVAGLITIISVYVLYYSLYIKVTKRVQDLCSQAATQNELVTIPTKTSGNYKEQVPQTEQED
ncbi:hypothetical protein RFI_07110 [Reticulomyxa filosa]|uniref:Uncharacterized protein n=1 Tax=Reticulomyxa filosa TaxID=46433 RepID=X6NUN2_RETFI|nr:hypothetical protein RFI_07110 [Reticulomyxa filosa]|eukprot:ETO30010.1 hypothetical protein RFI_07110 [Reticulomyxa filosa]